MKLSIIKEIFKGNAGNIQTIKLGKDFNKFDDICKIRKQLRNSFGEEQLKLLSDYETNIYSDVLEDIEGYFVEGFKLGLQIAVECLSEINLDE